MYISLGMEDFASRTFQHGTHHLLRGPASIYGPLGASLTFLRALKDGGDR